MNATGGVQSGIARLCISPLSEKVLWRIKLSALDALGYFYPFTSPGLLIVCERQSMRAERPERHHDDPVGFRNLSQYVMTSILTKAVMALREVTR